MEYVSGAGVAVQAVGNRIEFVLTVDQKVGAFFAGIELPGTVRLQKSNRRCRALSG